MRLCTSDTTSASHRPTLPLPAYLLLEAVRARFVPSEEVADQQDEQWTDTNQIMNLIVEVPFRLLGTPEVSSFYGEVHVAWISGNKQVVLMAFPNRTPLIHHYEKVLGAASQSDIEDASVERLTHWLRWLRG